MSVRYFKTVDDGIGAGVGASFMRENAEIIKRAVRRRKRVDLIACRLAFPAADAAGNIVKNPHAPRISCEMVNGRCLRVPSKANLASDGSAQPAEKLSPGNPHGA